MESDWITRDEAATILGVHKVHIHHRIKTGHLHKHIVPKVGSHGCTVMFSRAECEEVRDNWVPASPHHTPYNKSPSRDDCLYFAGFFDGEGCVRISSRPPRKGWKAGHHVSLSVLNVDLPVMHWAHDTFGGYLYGYRLKGENRRPALHWCAHAQIALHILRLIVPFLRVKKEQAELAIQVQEHISSRGWSKWYPLTDEEIEWREAMKDKISQLKQPINP